MATDKVVREVVEVEIPRTLAGKRAQSRALLILGMSALVDALYKNETIGDDGIGCMALRSGAQSVREIVREVAEGL